MICLTAIRNVELAEVKRLEAEAKRKAEEKNRRLEQEKKRVNDRRELEEKIAARSFAYQYLGKSSTDQFPTHSHHSFSSSQVISTVKYSICLKTKEHFTIQ
jgi:ABC-type Fe3+-citrate transport system substrate-binding protein